MNYYDKWICSNPRLIRNHFDIINGIACYHWILISSGGHLRIQWQSRLQITIPDMLLLYDNMQENILKIKCHIWHKKRHTFVWDFTKICSLEIQPHFQRNYLEFHYHFAYNIYHWLQCFDFYEIFRVQAKMSFRKKIIHTL